MSGLLPLVDPSVRARVQAELTPTGSRKASRRRRERFLQSLYHSPPFDRRYVVESWAGPVETVLVARGAPSECYVISNDRRYDRTTMPLHDALATVGEGSILICICGRLAYYEGEDGRDCWIVERRP